MKITNRKARYEYEVLQEYNAGISLFGSEVKSIKAGKCNISEAYCYVTNNNEVIMKNCHISKYDSDKYTNHEELRDRKLLLTKNEIRHIHSELEIKGITLIPLSLYITNTGLIKVNIGICKGKKLYDKRESIKERDIKREMSKQFVI